MHGIRGFAKKSRRRLVKGARHRVRKIIAIRRRIISDLILTPKDVAIHPRDIAFCREGAPPRWWMNGDPVKTAIFNSLSISFPPGEHFFIQCVRRYSDLAPPELKEQIAAFSAQEAAHSREHAAFNRLVATRGYDIARAQAVAIVGISLARKRTPLEQLAVTVGIEHLTAIFAHEALTNPRQLEHAPQEVQRLWQWHSIEEIEHKSVAYDTFMMATMDHSGLFRWALRSRMMFLSTLMLSKSILRGSLEFFRQDKINTISSWFQVFWFVFIRPGGLRRVALPYFRYYVPGFHPWQIDDRALLTRARLNFGLA